MYTVNEDTIIFNHEFNDELTPNLIETISKYNKLDFNVPYRSNNNSGEPQFNKSIDHIKNGLKKIHLKGNFNHPVNKLPESLESLELELLHFEYNLNSLPKGLRTLSFNGINIRIDNLPNKLASLDVGFNFSCNIDILPGTITFLHLRREFNKHVGNLPNRLNAVVFGKKFNKKIDNIPNSTNRIMFHDDIIPNIQFNKKIRRLPEHITSFQYFSAFSTDKKEQLVLSYINKKMNYWREYYRNHKCNNL